MLHILILDDDATTRKLLRDVFERLLKHGVKEAVNVSEAVQLARTESFDLMFLDQNLPDGTVLDFCQMLAQLGISKKIPKWVVTGEKPLEWNSQIWYRYGVLGYMVKPFQIETLIDIADRCLKQKAV